ncbi:AraC family transcriptional regulator [Acetobacterium paludosum]|uniref:AraC family transcriptional regulator n=1 Tax=Acetobacterium paludosum TaxID=52693 RepID=A0A923I116_9FIRM|nr:AraC family transcriptional regulator [Acetobacterium paludosum]MBC3888118.1 AraC family transcriptional regulator [Acetobacterium paludosum]
MGDLIDKYANEKGWAQEQYVLACVSRGYRKGIEDLLSNSEFIAQTKELFKDDLFLIINSYMFVWPQVSRIAVYAGVSESAASEIYLKYTMKMRYVKSIQKIMDINLCLCLEYADAVAKAKEEAHYSTLVCNCRAYIREHINDQIEIGHIADALKYSQSYLSHIYKKETGETIYQRVKIEKIAVAKLLLQYPLLSLSDIQSKLGYYSQSHFGHFFKNETGMSPREYRTKCGRKLFASYQTADKAILCTETIVGPEATMKITDMENFLDWSSRYAEGKESERIDYLLSCVRRGKSSEIEKEFADLTLAHEMEQILHDNIELTREIFQYIWPQVALAAIEGGLRKKQAMVIYNSFKRKSDQSSTFGEILWLNKRLFLEFAEAVAH